MELADGCAENLVYIVSQLISMHHIGDPAILKEWEVRCLVDPLGPNSDQHQFSHNNRHRLSRDWVMRIDKMITLEKML